MKVYGLLRGDQQMAEQFHRDTGFWPGYIVRDGIAELVHRPGKRNPMAAAYWQRLGSKVPDVRQGVELAAAKPFTVPKVETRDADPKFSSAIERITKAFRAPAHRTSRKV